MNNKGVIYGLTAYLLWGFFPLYWHLLSIVPPQEILLHRIIWSLIFLIILLLFKKQWNWINAFVKDKKRVLITIAAACLLGINWYIYIWGVNTDRVVETSLGYFINPLVNVFLGVLFLHERLRSGQWLAVAIAGIGVAYLTIASNALPWIALSLALTFGLYGLFKKKSKLNATESLTAEMAFLFIPACFSLIFLEASGQAQFGHSNLQIFLLLIGSGAVTAIPLLFFGAAAGSVPLSMLGLLQYIAPTIQFLIGVFIFQEPFTPTRLIGFLIIWLALAIYSVESYYQRKTNLKLKNTSIKFSD